MATLNKFIKSELTKEINKLRREKFKNFLSGIFKSKAVKNDIKSRSTDINNLITNYKNDVQGLEQGNKISLESHKVIRPKLEKESKKARTKKNAYGRTGNTLEVLGFPVYLANKILKQPVKALEATEKYFQKKEIQSEKNGRFFNRAAKAAKVTKDGFRVLRAPVYGANAANKKAKNKLKDSKNESRQNQIDFENELNRIPQAVIDALDKRPQVFQESVSQGAAKGLEDELQRAPSIDVAPVERVERVEKNTKKNKPIKIKPPVVKKPKVKKPKVKKPEPTKNKKVGPDRPELTRSDAQRDVKVAPDRPELTRSEAQRDIKVNADRPELTRSEAKRDIKVAPDKPELKRSDAQRDVKVNADRPELTRSDAQRDVKVAPDRPELTRSDAQRDVKVAPDRPELKRSDAQRDIKVASDRPGIKRANAKRNVNNGCLLYTSPSPRDRQKSRMPCSA